jgi:phage tail-like protein
VTTLSEAATIWPRANFKVLIGDIDLGCCEVRGLSSETMVAAARPASIGSQVTSGSNTPKGPTLGIGVADAALADQLGGSPVASAGPAAVLEWTLTPLLLRRAIDGDRTLFEWRANVLAGARDLRNVQIALLAGPGGAPVQAWLLVAAWPWSWSGPTLDAVDSGVALEQSELVYRSLQWLDNPEIGDT